MKEYLKIGEFSKLAKISRKLLIFYDNNGILHPEYIDSSNGYRYYRIRQIDTAAVIISLRRIGMPLRKIRDYLSKRSPENLIRLLEEQETRLDSELRELQRIKGMIQLRKEQVQSGINAVPGCIQIRDCLSENLFLGPPLPNDYSFATGWTSLPDFYRSCMNEKIPIGFAYGSMIEHKQIGDYLQSRVSHYYYRLPPDVFPTYYRKPAGRYIIATDYIDYECIDILYQRVLSYIHENNLKIIGNAYAEHLIDELSTSDQKAYLLQVSVQIQ